MYIIKGIQQQIQESLEEKYKYKLQYFLSQLCQALPLGCEYCFGD